MSVSGRLLGVLLLCLALATGCAGGPADPDVQPADETVDYLPNTAADVYVPPDGAAATTPVAVLIPGGGWRTADRSGLRPLGGWLAARGVPAVVATYRAADDGVRLPRSVADIMCASAFAAVVTSGEASAPRPVVLVGHSSGAHLAAVAALGPAADRPNCRWPPARLVGLAGLAGPYDVIQFADQVQPLIGAVPTADPEGWEAADPIRLAAHPPPGFAVLLLHGTADSLVPARQTSALALALRVGGADVTARLLAGADHDSVYTPRVAGPPLLEWLADEW